MQSPPLPRYLVPPRSKYSPQHRVLKHPQLPCEIVYVYKFMKTESEVGITIHLSKVQKSVAELTVSTVS